MVVAICRYGFCYRDAGLRRERHFRFPILEGVWAFEDYRDEKFNICGIIHDDCFVIRLSADTKGRGRIPDFDLLASPACLALPLNQ